MWIRIRRNTNNKNVISDSEIKRIQKRTIEKYCYDPNNEYYTQEKTYANLDEPIMKYMRKNVVPYNDWNDVLPN